MKRRTSLLRGSIERERDFVKLFSFTFSAAVQDSIHSSWERSDHLTQHGDRIQHVGEKKFDDTVKQAKQLVQVVMADVSKQLTSKRPLSLLLLLSTTHFSGVVDRYNAPFDEQALSIFKQGLYSHVDLYLSEELSRLASSSLSDLHQSVCQEVITSYQQLLEIPLNELAVPTHKSVVSPAYHIHTMR